MRNLIVFTIFLLATTNCKQTVEPTDLIVDFILDENAELFADGRNIPVQVVLHPDAADEFREVIFTTSAGTFVGQENGMLKVAATKFNGEITAWATLMAPLAPSTAEVSVEINLPERRGEFLQEKTLVFQQSEPTKVALSANAFSVYNNFEGEVTITGQLSNAFGNGVNLETRVELIDLLPSQTSAGGRFRAQEFLSNSDSKISAIYAAGDVPDSTQVLIVVNVLNQAGLPIVDQEGRRVPDLTDTLILEITTKR